jgi:uncharacterized protein
MPVNPTYPGVYVEELPSTTRTVSGVSTSSTAFADFFARGPVDQAVQVNSFRDFERIYDGLHPKSEASYAIFQYFNNGGQVAWVVRVADATAQAASTTLEIVDPSLGDLVTQADKAAQDADAAAAAAGTAATKVTSDITPSSPPAASSEAQAAQLAADLQEGAKQTSAAADAAQRAAVATEQASLGLEVAVKQAGATSGAGARQAQAAADDAAQAAKDAADAADAAAKAATAAAQADPTQLDAAQKASEDAAKAADAAAKAAAAAADKASDATIAADSARAAGAGAALVISAANPGVWGNSLRISLSSRPTNDGFDLYAYRVRKISGKVRVIESEIYRQLNLDEHSARFAEGVVNNASGLIRLDYQGPRMLGAYPEPTETSLADDPMNGVALTGGLDGGLPAAQDLIDGLEAQLDNIAPNIFNILCLPGVANYSDGEARTALTSALTYCALKRAFLIVDIPPRIDNLDAMKSWAGSYLNADNFNGAIYFPRLIMPDPLQEYRPRNVGASGTLAGIYARTDTARGVWKAPAGIEAAIQGADLAVKLTDDQTGQLNPLGINVLRSFPVYGNVVWGARTLSGADQTDSQWKYVNVRRLTDYIEESLFQSLKWVVFEPNDESTWSQIRLEVNSFMAGLFASGAFQGATPDKAFFVHCDATTTTATDIDRGIVNIVVGFAPVKPAEFVILQIEQIAGQTV